MNISLIKRIILIAIIPSLAFAAAISFVVYQNFVTIDNLDQAASDLHGVKKTSGLISSLQKERGFSALFITSGRKLGQRLGELRQETDANIEDLKKFYNEGHTAKEHMAALEPLLDEIKNARLGVDSSATKEGTIAAYSKIVASFIALETINKSGVSADTFARLKNFVVLEETGEAMGLLRARLSSILSSDLPFGSNQFNEILRLKGTVYGNLHGSSLKSFSQTYQKVTELQNQDHWKTISSVFQNVIGLANEGGFGEDSQEFFKTISKSVAGLKAISQFELQQIQSAIESEKASSQRSVVYMVGSMLLILLGIALLIYHLTAKTNQDLLKMLASFESISQDLIETSAALNQASQEMNLSSVSQSSSIEETAASVEEISAMTKNNVERAKGSSESSKMVSNLAEQSSESMKNLINSIEKIEESNQQVQNISKLISGISDKTDMIDEIVLQTKLLSFNASVEAERAGEYGRGFSVVASEVGKLAQISGKSAVEISAIVNEAVKESNSIAGENSKRVSSSSQLVKEYSKTLTEIRGSAKSLSEKAAEVLNASNEQSSGLNQINEALQQLDQVNQKNKAAADETAATSVLIQEKAHELDETVIFMRRLLGQDRQNQQAYYADDHHTGPSVGQENGSAEAEYRHAS